MTSTARLLHGQKRKRRSCEDYTIGCICPMGIELAPLRAMLDVEHDDLPIDRDRNAYILGEMGKHNVAICVLSSIGTNGSAVAATRFKDDFPAIQFFLLIGIAGGVPGPSNATDIRLGDVVVSTPSGTTGGVVQFDYGKALSGNKLKVTGHLNKPPHALTAYVKTLEARYEQRQSTGLEKIIDATFQRNPRMQEKYKRPAESTDQLFATNYEHADPEVADCLACDLSHLVLRPTRTVMHSTVHYGTIGSSNMLIRDAEKRDQLRKEFGVLAVEMEAAGLVDLLPCLVIRGICDYADSHKNKRWQPYAALVAAAYANDLLQVIPSKARQVYRVVPEADDDQSETEHLSPVSDTLADRRKIQPARFPTKPDITDKALYSLLSKSLTFSRMDARMHNIPDAMLKTCTWLFDHPVFHTWLDGRRTQEHHGFLWIRGKPGSGKSTIMKAILDSMKRKKDSENLVSYFFNARASGTLEKSILGMYRSLVFQVLAVDHSLEVDFLEHFRSKYGEDEIEDWTVVELQNFLLTIARHNRIQRLNILIDALDEGDNDHDVRQMVSFLEDLTQNANNNCSSLRICLSTRHYPWFKTHKSVSLVMEDQPGHDDDIKLYIRNKLACGSNSELEKFQKRIHEKAAGVFLWVVLVIPLLNEAYDEGQIDAMTSVLDSVPEELDSVFARVLSRSRQHIPECIALLQWTMFSKRSLSPSETLTAIRCSVGTKAYEQPQPMSDDNLRRYLLHCSRGLTEISASHPPVVQFIHETVRDYIGRRGGIATLSQDLAHNIKGLSHERLKDTCYKYLKNHPSSGQSVIKDSRNRRAIFKARILEKDAFLEYSVNNIFWHAEMAQRNDISQRAFLSQHISNLNSGFALWVHLHNAYETVIANRYTSDVPLMYLFAERDLGGLVHLLVTMSESDSMTKQRYGTALQAACHFGHEEVVRTILEAGTAANARGDNHKFAFLMAARRGHWATMKILVKHGVRPQDMGILEYFGSKKSIMSKLCQDRDQTLVDILLELAVDVNTRLDASGTTLLMAATQHGPIELVQQLLAADADIHMQKEMTINGQPGVGGPLLIAIEAGNLMIAQMLLENGANEHTQSCACVFAAITLGHHDMAMSLLKAGANIEPTESGMYPLVIACMHPRLDIVQILLERGADANAHSDGDGPPLWEAIVTSGDLSTRTAVIEALVASGADVNYRGVLPNRYWSLRFWSFSDTIFGAMLKLRPADVESLVPLLRKFGAHE